MVFVVVDKDCRIENDHCIERIGAHSIHYFPSFLAVFIALRFFKFDDDRSDDSGQSFTSPKKPDKKRSSAQLEGAMHESRLSISVLDDSEEVDDEVSGIGKIGATVSKTGKVGAKKSATGKVGTTVSKTGKVDAKKSATGKVGTTVSKTGKVGAKQSATGKVGAKESKTGKVGAKKSATGEAGSYQSDIKKKSKASLKSRDGDRKKSGKVPSPVSKNEKRKPSLGRRHSSVGSSLDLRVRGVYSEGSFYSDSGSGSLTGSEDYSESWHSSDDWSEDSTSL